MNKRDPWDRNLIKQSFESQNKQIGILTFLLSKGNMERLASASLHSNRR